MTKGRALPHTQRLHPTATLGSWGMCMEMAGGPVYVPPTWKTGHTLDLARSCSKISCYKGVRDCVLGLWPWATYRCSHCVPGLWPSATHRSGSCPTSSGIQAADLLMQPTMVTCHTLQIELGGRIAGEYLPGHDMWHHHAPFGASHLQVGASSPLWHCMGQRRGGRKQQRRGHRLSCAEQSTRK